MNVKWIVFLITRSEYELFDQQWLVCSFPAYFYCLVNADVAGSVIITINSS